MKISVRASALAIAVAAGASLVVPLAVPASAALTPSVACAKVNAPPVKNGKLASVYSACTPAALAAGGNSLTKVDTSGPTSGKLINTITWKNGKGTTKTSIKYAGAKTNGKCKAPTKRVTITGSVVSSTGAAAKIIKNGEPLTGSVCAITAAGPNQGLTVIEPGTKFKL